MIPQEDKLQDTSETAPSTSAKQADVVNLLLSTKKQLPSVMGNMGNM